MCFKQVSTIICKSPQLSPSHFRPTFCLPLSVRGDPIAEHLRQKEMSQDIILIICSWKIKIFVPKRFLVNSSGKDQFSSIRVFAQSIINKRTFTNWELSVWIDIVSITTWMNVFVYKIQLVKFHTVPKVAILGYGSRGHTMTAAYYTLYRDWKS